jgi:hypothetical protein
MGHPDVRLTGTPGLEDMRGLVPRARRGGAPPRRVRGKEGCVPIQRVAHFAD